MKHLALAVSVAAILAGFLSLWTMLIQIWLTFPNVTPGPYASTTMIPFIVGLVFVVATIAGDEIWVQAHYPNGWMRGFVLAAWVVIALASVGFLLGGVVLVFVSNELCNSVRCIGGIG